MKFREGDGIQVNGDRKWENKGDSGIFILQSLFLLPVFGSSRHPFPVVVFLETHPLLFRISGAAGVFPFFFGFIKIYVKAEH